MSFITEHNFKRKFTSIHFDVWLVAVLQVHTELLRSIASSFVGLNAAIGDQNMNLNKQNIVLL